MIPDLRSGSGRRDEPIAEFDVLPPGGRWFRFRVPTRADRARAALAISGIVVLSAALWLLPLMPVLRWAAGW